VKRVSTIPSVCGQRFPALARTKFTNSKRLLARLPAASNQRRRSRIATKLRLDTDRLPVAAERGKRGLRLIKKANGCARLFLPAASRLRDRHHEKIGLPIRVFFSRGGEPRPYGSRGAIDSGQTS
jgi:hypothetical protein